MPDQKYLIDFVKTKAPNQRDASFTDIAGVQKIGVPVEGEPEASRPAAHWSARIFGSPVQLTR